MLEWLDVHISLTTLIWLFPITFLIHDFEEIIFVEAWFRKNYVKVVDKVPVPMRKTFQEMSETTAARFSIPVFLQFIVYIMASYLAAEQQNYGMFLGFNIVLFLHVFGHVGQSLWFGVYALGVGTAMLITLPYSLYLFHRLIEESLVDMSDFFINLPYGLITAMIVLNGHKLARKIVAE